MQKGKIIALINFKNKQADYPGTYKREHINSVTVTLNLRLVQ